MSDDCTPQDGPDEPAEPPEGRASPSMPADPFTAADMGHVVIANLLNGLDRAGVHPVLNALFTASHLAISNMLGETRKAPEQETP